jgi:hypothetical protein
MKVHFEEHFPNATLHKTMMSNDDFTVPSPMVSSYCSTGEFYTGVRLVDPVSGKARRVSGGGCGGVDNVAALPSPIVSPQRSCDICFNSVPLRKQKVINSWCISSHQSLSCSRCCRTTRFCTARRRRRQS